jgi:dolichyl-phosphate beta-glucosyltransferase
LGFWSEKTRKIKMKLSVVIPAYNEEKRIAATLKDVNSYLKKQAYDYEIIVVVNNSHDKTFEIVEKLEASTIAKASAMNLVEGGKGNAVKRGILKKASGDIIMFMDADNATPISEIEKFLPFFDQGYDVVIGSRYTNPDLVKHHQPLYRIILSRLSNILIQFLAVPGIKDTQLGFKAFSQKAAKDIFSIVSINRWGFDMEVLTIALAHNYKIKEVGVSWTEYGGSHVPMKAYVQSLYDLLKIKVNSLSGKYKAKKNQAVPSTIPHLSVRDYDLAALAGLLSGICLIPILLNVGFHKAWIFISLPLVMALLWVVGLWLARQMANWIEIILQIAKFAEIGVLNTLINFGFLNLISLLTGVTSGLSVGGINIPGTILAASNSYFWNKFWVFKKIDKKGIFADAPGFILVTIIGLLINSVIIVLFTSDIRPAFAVSSAGWLNIGKVIATLIGILVDFLGYKFLVFKKKN